MINDTLHIGSVICDDVPGGPFAFHAHIDHRELSVNELPVRVTDDCRLLLSAVLQLPASHSPALETYKGLNAEQLLALAFEMGFRDAHVTQLPAQNAEPPYRRVRLHFENAAVNASVAEERPAPRVSETAAILMRRDGRRVDPEEYRLASMDQLLRAADAEGCRRQVMDVLYSAWHAGGRFRVTNQAQREAVFPVTVEDDVVLPPTQPLIMPLMEAQRPGALQSSDVKQGQQP